MGTSGNRKGYKVFSINTTVRNPKRNIDFLIHFEKFNGFIFNNEVKRLYFIELVKNGVYKFNNISSQINEKLINDIVLSDDEIDELFNKNPQATGFEGRVMTQLRALKDQGFLLFYEPKRGNLKITITKLGFDLINRNEYITDIYSKAMIGLHANNPTRVSIFNKSRVFLNTLFVINLLKKKWREISNKQAKGILKHEFLFVLAMKDNDYEKCVDEILKYRAKNGFKKNLQDIKKYLFNVLKLLKISDTTLDDYIDDVFRKFEMTGLLMSRGAFENIYYDFSNFNIKKVEAILEFYKDYKFENFKTADDYVNFLSEIKLPWLKDSKVRAEIIKDKAKNLNYSLINIKSQNLDEIENTLDQIFYSNVLKEAIQKYKIEDLIKELEILSQNSQEKSKFDDLSEPLRLEYVLALLFGLKFGISGLNSNLVYDENGYPISFAPAGRVDLKYNYFLIEATMIKNRNQQLNAETTSIARHMKEAKNKENMEFRTMLIAPLIHWDIALFFKFCTKEFNSLLIPLSINKFIDIIQKSKNLDEFKFNFDAYGNKLLTLNSDKYIDFINK